jgi:hypothetical protein
MKDEDKEEQLKEKERKKEFGGEEEEEDVCFKVDSDLQQHKLHVNRQYALFLPFCR